MSLHVAVGRSGTRRTTVRLRLVRALALVLLTWCGTETVRAQQADSLRTATPVDSLRALPDSLRAPPLSGPTPQTEQSGVMPGAGPTPAGSGEGVVRITARDSLHIDLRGGEEVVRINGETEITLEGATLKAHNVDFYLSAGEMRARGLAVDTGLVGRPTFTIQEEQILGDELAYNLDTQRGRVLKASTAIEDGMIFGEVSKQFVSDSMAFIQNGYYTTCARCATSCVGECAPSYSLKSGKLKVTENQVYTGPIYLRIFNIPTPIWLPFGVLPPIGQEGSKSGPLAPNYGEDPQRGFYLRDLGWYFAMNDYMDLQLRFGVWTLGSWQVNPEYRYNKRYRYAGRLAVDYVVNKAGERGDPERFRRSRTDRSLRWNHNQTINPNTQFTADVNLSSQSYLQTVSRAYNDQIRQTVESNVNFTRRWPGSGRTLTFFAGHRQLLSTGEVTSTLPRLRFSQRSKNPFKGNVQRSSGERWYEKITYSYNANIDNIYRFDPDTSRAGAAEITWIEALFSGQKFTQATGETEPFDFVASHEIPISAAFSVQRVPVLNKVVRLNLTPNFNYEEDYYIQTNRRFIDPSTGRPADSTVAEFKAVRQFSTGIGANSEFYGQFPLRVGRFQGLRHVVRPSLNFSYQPDFTAPRFGYYLSYTDTLGNEIDFPLTATRFSGEQRRVSYSINNVFQSKSVRVDSTGDEQSRTIQLLTLNLGSSFNFAADSLKMAPIAVTARTKVLDQFDLNVTSSLTPYRTDSLGRSIDRYVLGGSGWSPVRLQRLNVTARTSIRSKRRSGESRPVENDYNLFGRNDPRFSEYGGIGSLDPSQTYGMDPFGEYTDFAIPWSLDLDFTYGLSRTGTRTTRTAVINTGFDFNVTPNWKIQGRSGYDIIRDEFVTTNINIFRDLGCWEMSFRWNPFGRYQSYQFSLNVKSGKLSEYLKLRHPRRDIQNRFDF